MARAARGLRQPLVSIPTAQASEALANVLNRAGPLAVVIHGLEGLTLERRRVSAESCPDCVPRTGSGLARPVRYVVSAQPHFLVG